MDKKNRAVRRQRLPATAALKIRTVEYVPDRLTLFNTTGSKIKLKFFHPLLLEAVKRSMPPKHIKPNEFF